MTSNSRALRRCAALLAGAAALGMSVAARADADTAGGPNTVRVGEYFVHYSATANDVSGPFTPSGINLSVASLHTPYFAYLRDLTPHLSLELTAGVPPVSHTYGRGPATLGSVPFNGVEVATAKWLSTTLLLEYNFLEPSSKFRPFVGVGVNFTKFYERNSTAGGDAANGGPTSISLSNSVGPAATVGAVYRLPQGFQLSASYSKAQVNSDYASDTAGIVRTTRVHFNPSTFIFSVGYSF